MTMAPGPYFPDMTHLYEEDRRRAQQQDTFRKTFERLR